MDTRDGLAERFEAHRADLRAVAYRMLGSRTDADDAVQEVWVRLDRTDGRDIENLAGWLRTVLSRICLDMLRARRSRREAPVGLQVPDTAWDEGAGGDPEHEALIADSVGRALLVVLERLTPAERVAFVLHDMLAVSFEEIATIVGRSLVAAKKLASRARQKVRGKPAVPAAELARQRHVVDAFLTASRRGDVEGLLAILDPGVVRRADPAALPPGIPAEVRGAREVAKEAAVFSARSAVAEVALVDGLPGIVVAPRGHLQLALTLTLRDGRITACDVIADPARLGGLTLAILGAESVEE